MCLSLTRSQHRDERGTASCGEGATLPGSTPRGSDRAQYLGVWAAGRAGVARVGSEGSNPGVSPESGQEAGFWRETGARLRGSRPLPRRRRGSAAAPPSSSCLDAGGGRGAPPCDAPSSLCPSAAAAVPGAPHGPGRPERAPPLNARPPACPRPGPGKVTCTPRVPPPPRPRCPSSARPPHPRLPLSDLGCQSPAGTSLAQLGALSAWAGAVRRRGAEAARARALPPAPPCLQPLASPLVLPRPLYPSFLLLARSRLRASPQSRATRPPQSQGSAAAGARPCPWGSSSSTPTSLPLGPAVPSPPGARGEVWKRICFAAKASLRASTLREGGNSSATRRVSFRGRRGGKHHKTVALRGPGFPCQKRPYRAGWWGMPMQVLQKASAHQSST